MAIDKALTPAVMAVIDPEIGIEFVFAIGETKCLAPEEATADATNPNLAEYIA